MQELLKAMYGTRDAAQTRQRRCPETVKKLGFVVAWRRCATFTTRSGMCADWCTAITLCSWGP